MTLREIYTFLDQLSPFSLQEKWDNSGLMLGDFDQTITTIALSIDVDDALIHSLPENSLLITHHPLIFGGLKQLNTQHYPANLLTQMIRKNISNIAMHTNFDQTHLNDYVATEVLGYTITAKEGFVTYFEVNDSFETFSIRVKQRFNLEILRGVQSHEWIGRCALVTGSGASLMRSVGADCLLTGDIKYHDAMEAKALGISLLDIGHYESEHYFGTILAGHLEKLGLSVIISPSQNPFTYH